MRSGIVAMSAALLIWTSAAAASQKIDDPANFVSRIYSNPEDPTVPDAFYTPRLRALFKLEAQETPEGEIGRFDFDFWTSSNAPGVSDLRVTKRPVEESGQRQVVIARFKNNGNPTEIHFYFEKTASGWKLDDARSVVGNQWTLSLVLKYGND